MAVYVTSDAHGHVRALDEVLSQLSLGEDDELYVLGDMIDRGPDPLGVIRLVRSLPHAQVIMGNHERLMLTALAHTGPPYEGEFELTGLDIEGFSDWSGWMLNGGAATADQLARLDLEDYEELLEWVCGLPLFATVVAGGRCHALVHAGIDPAHAALWLSGRDAPDLTSPEVLHALLAAQDEEDLLWVRDAFWGAPTGLVDETGAGPIVVAGHTPSPYLRIFANDPELVCATEEGLGMVVELGASEQTGGVADRIDVDCAAAGGFGMGRVGVLRLDDRATWYAEIREGE